MIIVKKLHKLMIWDELSLSLQIDSYEREREREKEAYE